jgi:hypothetical protein
MNGWVNVFNQGFENMPESRFLWLLVGWFLKASFGLEKA